MMEAVKERVQGISTRHEATPKPGSRRAAMADARRWEPAPLVVRWPDPHTPRYRSRNGTFASVVLAGRGCISLFRELTNRSRLVVQHSCGCEEIATCVGRSAR